MKCSIRGVCSWICKLTNNFVVNQLKMEENKKKTVTLRTPFVYQVIFEIGIFDNMDRSFVGSSKQLVQIVVIVVGIQ